MDYLDLDLDLDPPGRNPAPDSSKNNESIIVVDV